MSLALRHSPETFGLQLDEHGYVEVPRFSEAIITSCPWATPEYIRTFVAGPGQRRFILKEDRVAARYGHSIDVVPDGQPCDPPEVLYHGADPRNRDRIMAEGIRPMGRKFVHLSMSIQEAQDVASRHARYPIVLKVFAKKAADEGSLQFFQAGHLYLVREIPSKYLEPLRS
jgi:putative RNA 2'-phosphotransferase